MSDFDEMNKLSITSYLESRGIKIERKAGSKTWFSSPFSSDSKPSFIVYEHNNSFYDFSTGYGGTLIDLVIKLENDCSPREALTILSSGPLLPIKTRVASEPKKKKPINVESFLTYRPKEVSQVREYAASRCIHEGYGIGAYNTEIDGKWFRRPSMMFIHKDEDLEVCGVKFRHASHEVKEFSARGRMCFYVLENLVDKMEASILFLVESETSANSLYELAKSCGISCVVMSIGSVGSKVRRLPSKYDSINERKVIIDYDGDEELYQTRVEQYLSFGEPIKLVLEKGEDINSLYSKNEIEYLKNNLFKS